MNKGKMLHHSIDLKRRPTRFPTTWPMRGKWEFLLHKRYHRGFRLTIIGRTNRPFALSLSKGIVWFDKALLSVAEGLTTNGVVSR